MTTKPEEVFNRVLDYKESPVIALSLDELRQTVSERNSGGKPINSCEHFEMFDRIIEKIEQSSHPYKVNTIHTSDGGDRTYPGVTRIPYLEGEYGQMSLQSTLLRRAIGTIDILSNEDEESVGSLAIAFHQRGIQVAYGQKVKVCSNMSIFGAENVMSTYSFGTTSKIENVNKIIEVIGDWLHNHVEKRERDQFIMRRMKEITVDYDEVSRLIGELNIMRVRKDTLHELQNYALNQTQINQFIERYIKKYKVNPEDVSSLWSIYNIGTEFHKAGTTDLPLIIPNNVTFSDYLMGRYSLAPVTVEPITVYA